MGKAPNPILAGKDESSLPSLVHTSELGCNMSLDAYHLSNDRETFLRLISLRRLDVEVSFSIMIAIGIFIVVPVSQELS